MTHTNIAPVRPDSAASGPEMTLGIVLAPRSDHYTRASFQAHYEAFHAPLFYSFAKPAIGRYARNHIVRAIGTDPHFDTISEFGIFPDKRGELSRILHSPEARALEEDVHTFLAERGNSFTVSERLIAGPPRYFEPGPVAKRAILLRTNHPDDADFDDYAKTVAARLGNAALRVTLSVWNREPPPPMDAMLMIWPAEGASLPDPIEPPTPITIAHTLDLDGYMTAWRD